MAETFERDALALGLGLSPGNAVFDLERADAAVFRALVQGTPQLAHDFATLRSKIPLPRNANTDMENRFYRLPSHNRSFCYAMGNDSDVFGNPVVVFKGTEPLLGDFETFVDWMTKAPFRKSTRVMADHFPLAEGKVPGALSLEEAMREAAIALELQSKHLQFYGELARLPTPLVIHAFSVLENTRTADVLRRKISPPAFARIEATFARGLGVYVYHYPAAPIRTNYWGGMSNKKLTEHVAKSSDETRALQGWVTLIVRLLYLGYLPDSIRNQGLGACMDAGNATIDGGFCDPDSVIPIATSPDDEFFAESFIQCLTELQATAEGLIASRVVKSDFCPNIETFAFSRYIGRLVETAIDTEARPGLTLDPRISTLLSPRSLADVKSSIKRQNRPNWYSMFLKRAGH